ALDELFNGVGPADRVVFYYSGHGYQQVINGNKEEYLVTQDIKFFHDDDFSKKTQGLPDGVLTVVLDSCFSGGMEKRLIAWRLTSNLSQNVPFSAGMTKIKSFIPYNVDIQKL